VSAHNHYRPEHHVSINLREKISLIFRDVETVFWENRFSVLKTGLKPVFGLTNLHKNVLLYKANNFFVTVRSGMAYREMKMTKV